MKLLISWVRDFVDVSAPADELAASLALRGFEVASIEPMGVGDAVIDFEVTANRPDCLSVLGLAREIATAYDLLVFFMRHLRQAFTREELLDQVWNWSFGDTSTVTVHVRRLREKLEPDPTQPRRIVTVWGVGYRYEPGDA